MKLKKIYLEITNTCNLNCSFCIKNQRKPHTLTIKEYHYIINKIKPYTKELYLHVLGEPLLHKDINYFIEYAHNNNLKVNITTNGYLINNLSNDTKLSKLNISLHSYQEKYNISLNEYLDKIFNKVDYISKSTYITLRIWIKDKNTPKIINYLNNRYNSNIKEITNSQKIKIAPNILIDTFHEFIWPDLSNNYYNELGTCKGLIDHLGILSNGTIIPCCLDSRGEICLGNIYENSIPEIYEKKLVQDMIKGFKNNKKCQELCRHCHFL